ncbi:MAG: PD40 domain-containing protein [Saprospiraceae bacterium]|nr:PD40 domain-containing protein [Saprospiraceae bacterium]
MNQALTCFSAPSVFWGLCLTFFSLPIIGSSQGTRLLRQPTISQNKIAFTYASDIWISDIAGGTATRLTSTPAVESNPAFSPDGKWIAFSSNRAGGTSVYVVSAEGGMPKRLSYYPAAAAVRGWTPDGKHIIYASRRESAPGNFNRLWKVSPEGGPSEMLPVPWANDGSYKADGKHIAIDRMRRWDVEWRAYRGGQNTPLILLNLDDLSEEKIPNEQRTTDVQPIWMGDKIYFLSDRDWVSNIWSYDTKSKALKQITRFKGSDIKSLTGMDGILAFERDGYLHTLRPGQGRSKQLSITVVGDYPWAATRWEDVTGRIRSLSLSPTGKRALVEARGEIFTIPAKDGAARNLTKSSGAADRSPIWSPKGDQVAWFSDKSGKYTLMLTSQDGLGDVKSLDLGESKMVWNPSWSPDGKYISFVDDDVRIRVLEVENGNLKTIDVGGNNIERGSITPQWSPDSKWLTYAKSASNNFRQVKVWSVESNEAKVMTDPLADAFAPSWDRGGKHLYFLASTDVALGSGWANTSAMGASPEYGAYVIVLREGDDSPFAPKSDEEPVKKDKKEKENKKEESAEGKKEEPKKPTPKKKPGTAIDTVKIDWDKLGRRTLALPIPVNNYRFTMMGPKGSVFIGERVENTPGITLKKFELKTAKLSTFVGAVRNLATSADGKKLIVRTLRGLKIVDTARPPGKGGTSIRPRLRMKLDRLAEWEQIFNEAWRYERDFFYDPNMHGRDWDKVKERYAPLIPFVRHRDDLRYVLDQVNGELSVGHSFVFGGDLPAVDTSRVGLLGADLVAENGRWRIKRIYTTESWNPRLKAPLDRPKMKVEEGHYLVGIEGVSLTANDNPYEFLDGMAGRQIILHINSSPSMDGAWKETVQPIRSENALRQRAWVEDNRRKVDELSGGRLAYVWVPNTSFPGYVSFNRYFFAQQDKEGAVIDERYNGGGLLDDYMVDLMTRKLRAALTNEVPNGAPMRLPAGILGPKVLLINELAGSGGDFFPWVFRQQNAGPLIGARTWGGLVKSSVHYSMVDGSALTAPDNAVFDPINNKWVAENEGVWPDIEVYQDAKSWSEGRDVQLEKAVEEALKRLGSSKTDKITPPAYSKPAKKK